VVPLTLTTPDINQWWIEVRSAEVDEADISCDWFVEKLRHQWAPTTQYLEIPKAIHTIQQGKDSVVEYAIKLKQLKGKLPNPPDDLSMAFYFVQAINWWIHKGISASERKSYQRVYDQAIIVGMDNKRNNAEKQKSQSQKGKVEKPNRGIHRHWPSL